MKIIDIINQSADLLDLREAKAVLLSATNENEAEVLENEQVASLFNLIKFSIQELCTNYVPFLVGETVVTADCKYNLYKLKNYIRLHEITKNGEQVKYKIINRCLQFEEDGEYNIEYVSYPEINSLFEEIDFLHKFNADVMVYGLCAYFSLAHGLFEEFKGYHEIYVEKAENLRELKVFSMPQRSWQWNKKNVLK